MSSLDRVIGIFGFIGSGKSYLIGKLRLLEGFNPISKEEVGLRWYQSTYNTSDLNNYEASLYKEFKKDPLFLIRESSKLFIKGKINVIDSINTPIEDEFLRDKYEYLLLGIWRREEDRREGILNGRNKLIKTSEPTDDISFSKLDNLVKRYMHESGCLFCRANELIVNEGENLIKDFINIAKKWR